VVETTHSAPVGKKKQSIVNHVLHFSQGRLALNQWKFFLFLELRDNWYGTRDGNSKTLEQKDKNRSQHRKILKFEKYYVTSSVLTASSIPPDRNCS